MLDESDFERELYDHFFTILFLSSEDFKHLSRLFTIHCKSIERLVAGY
jgi:hypothetical protein|tara:strand:+ start:24402 stop:24545 length:144 start_codon:yes stop_codon:yes gene_type:complete